MLRSKAFLPLSSALLRPQFDRASKMVPIAPTLASDTRNFASTPAPAPAQSNPPKAGWDWTHAYYKDRADASLKKHFEEKDIYYDPYLPYVWTHAMPRALQPFLRFCRLDQNFGRMLVVSPHFWGIAIASPLGGLPDLLNMFLFAVGSLYGHGSGCAFNDVIDVKVDMANPRTAFRPLVAKTLSKPAGWTIITSMVGVAYGILMMLTPVATKVGLILTPFIAAYPFTKRMIQYPQAFLAFGLNMGVFMGFGAVTNAIYWPVCLPMYIAGIANTFCYDSILGMQDIEYDTKAGAFSTGQKVANRAKLFSGSLAAVSVSMHVLAGIMAGLHPVFLPILGMGAAHLAWQTWKLDPKNGPMCDHLFNVAYRYGVFVLAAYVAGVYFAKGKKRKIEEQISQRNKALEEEEEKNMALC